MKRIERRTFLSIASQAVAGAALLPRLVRAGEPSSCWLDVCAPFLIQDNSAGIESEIVLTSDNFIGANGYADGADATEYEIYLYDSAGRPFGADGVARRLAAPAMQTTVIPVRDLVG